MEASTKINIISYSLYNKRPKDVIGAIINCLLAPFVYPGWICRFYVDDTIPTEIYNLLKTFSHVEVVDMPRHTGSEAMLWRFLPASDPNVSVMISRDADSWLSSREAAAVNEWIQSDKDFHIIRDHCYHTQKIMGGMWGARNGVVADMKNRVQKFIECKGTYDQGFLATEIYPIVKEKNTMFIHFGDPQYDNKGTRMVNGHFNDGGVPLPNYSECDVKDLSFVEANKLNAFMCMHCKTVHRTFIGGILEHFPINTINYVKNYAKSHNISLDHIF